MNISATIKNTSGKNDIIVETAGNYKKIDIPCKPDGHGSLVNGGELLFLSLATCFCNDIYREAARRNMLIQSVEVQVTGVFGNEGEPGSDIRYHVKIDADSSQKEIADLITHVDKIAEVHNTLRKGTSVSLASVY